MPNIFTLNSGVMISGIVLFLKLMTLLYYAVFILAEVSLKKSFESFSMSSLVIEHYTHMRYFKGFSGLLKRITQFFTQLLLIVF